MGKRLPLATPSAISPGHPPSFVIRHPPSPRPTVPHRVTVPCPTPTRARPMSALPIREELQKSVGAVLGRTPSGLFVISAADADGRETAMLASWVQQASFSPPMVTVALNRKRYLNDWLA